MRVWVGVLAIAVTIVAVMGTFFPDAYLFGDDPPSEPVSGARTSLVNLAFFIYAAALSAVALRVEAKTFRPVVLSVLVLGPIGWGVVVLSAIREGFPIEIVGPLFMLLLTLGTPSVLAVLLETKFRAQQLAGG